MFYAYACKGGTALMIRRLMESCDVQGASIAHGPSYGPSYGTVTINDTILTSSVLVVHAGKDERGLSAQNKCMGADEGRKPSLPHP